MKKFFFSMIVCLFVVTQVMAQRTVSGKVTDDLGEGLPGVNVVIKGTTTGTTTDIDGNYRLQVNDDDILVFSFVGFETQEINTGTRSTIDVTMGGATELDEVVVVAYGEANKSTFVGSLGQVKSGQIENRPGITNVANVIDGNVSGVQVLAASGQPGSAPDFRIRGVGSINSNASPLFVVDGVVFNEGISNLNPSDIESLSVLKDASSAALYGARAANGVVVITTKTGKKGQSRVNFSATGSIVDRSFPDYETVGPREYYLAMWESLRNQRVTLGDDAAVAGQFATDNLIANLGGYNAFDVADNQLISAEGVFNPSANQRWTDTNWLDGLERTGNRQQYTMDYSSGNEVGDFFVSLAYLNEDGWLERSSFERISARINTNQNVNEWWKVGINASITNSTSTNNGALSGSNAFVNPIGFARGMAPIYPIYLHDPTTGEFVLDENGERIFDEGAGRFPGVARINSPGRHGVQENLLNEDTWERNFISARAYTEFKFLDGFKFRANIGTDIRELYTVNFDNPVIGDGNPGGRAGRDFDRRTTLTLNQLLTYDKTFGGVHNVSVLAGHESQLLVRRQSNIFKTGQVIDGNTELDNFAVITSAGSETDEFAIESYFGRVDYDYNNKYFFSATLRADGTSRFAEESRWGNFGSVGASWRIDQESFMSGISWVNILKLRTSYGELGNENIGSFYEYQGLFSLGFNNAGQSGIALSQLENRALTWETTISFDAGVDFTLFDGRLSGTFEYYERGADNLLLQRPLPVSSGFDAIAENIGKMVNSGFEIELSGDVIRQGDFTWNLRVNGTTQKNEIERLSQDEIINGTKKLVVGGGIFDFWLREYMGVDPDNGRPLYRADNPDPVDPLSDPDVTIVGNDTLTYDVGDGRFHFAKGDALPDLYGGITNTFTYKGFTLTTLMTYQIGGYVYDGIYAGLMSADYGDNLHADAFRGAWRNPGDITSVPQLNFNNNPNIGASDRWLTDNTHLNFRQITLSYQLPKNILDQIGIRSAQVSFSAENLRLWSKRQGMNVTQNFQGTTSNVFNPTRVLSLGLNVGL